MKRVFLTGASSGIGLATAQALLAAGHEVWGTSRRPERLPKDRHFHAVQLDLLQAGQLEDRFNAALAEASHFDVIINNAGSGHFGPAEYLSREMIAMQFQILVFAPLELMRLALTAMHKREQGLIINVTSLAARLPVPFMAAYNAGKAALASFTMTVQLELADSNIRIVDLQPGDICTEFNDAVVKADYGARYEIKAAKSWKAVDHNLRAAPKPEIVARRILQLMGLSNPPLRAAVGDAFQTKIAPFIMRFLPQRVRIWGLKTYYGI